MGSSNGSSGSGAAAKYHINGELEDHDHQPHVLAVDDSLTDRKLLERLLRNSAYRVTTADSGIRALEYLGMHGHGHGHGQGNDNDPNVNLIITDYCMPGMNGYELLKRVKESSTLKEIPVVVMSSEYVPTRMNKCLESGAKEFIMKPLQLSDVTRLRCHINGYN